MIPAIAGGWHLSICHEFAWKNSIPMEALAMEQTSFGSMLWSVVAVRMFSVAGESFTASPWASIVAISSAASPVQINVSSGIGILGKKLPGRTLTET